MNQKVKCPYCGNEIDNNAEKCPFCNERFEVPQIKGLKFTSMGQFLILGILFATFELYPLFCLIWMIMNYKVFGTIGDGKDNKKLNIDIGLLVLAIICGIILPANYIVYIVQWIIIVRLSYTLLNIINHYSVNKYNSDVTSYPFGYLFCNILYVVYFIDTFAERVEDPTMRFHLDLPGWIKYILLTIIGAAVVIFFRIYLYTPFIVAK